MNRQKEEIHLLDYWRILLKRRGVALTFFCLVMGIVMVYTFTATPVYQGTAQLLFDLERNQTMNFIEGAAVIQLKDPTEFFNTQKKIIKSRAFADRVVRKRQLDKNAYYLELKERSEKGIFSEFFAQVRALFPEKAKSATDPFPDSSFKEELDVAITDIILANVEMETGRQNNIMMIHYYADNPAVAASMANIIADAFIEHNMEIRVKPYRDAAEWLSARLVESKEKVSSSERLLQQYREGKGVVSFETRENVITQQLQELISQLVQTEAKRQEAEIRYKQIESFIDDPERLSTVPYIMNNLVIQGLRNEELGVKKQLAELAEKFGSKHPNVIKADSQLDTVQKNITAEARKMLSAAKTEFEIARSRETSLRRTIDAQKQEVMDLTRKAINFNVIAGESESNKRFYELLLKRFQEASLSSGINISNLQVVESASIPKSPVKPKRGMTLLLGLLVGGFGAIFAAFFIDYMDNTIKTAEDVEKWLNLPLLDIIPYSKEKGNRIFLNSDPKSAIAESFRTIRTALLLSPAARHLKIILVTSAIPNEGKTTTAANLAVAMAQRGEKVLLIDADMRRNSIHDTFGIENEAGLTEAIVDSANSSSSLKNLDEYPHLSIMTGGTRAPNPADILGSEEMRKLVESMKERFDRIILDSPPLLAFSDALVLARLADGVIIVTWGGKTPRDQIQKGVHLLEGIEAKILGVALNKIDTTKRSYYYYNYPYYADYYSESKHKKRKTA